MIMKRMMPMHYELYVDSLFFLNFVMNLYLLILVDRSLVRTFRFRRLTAGAAVGAFGYVLPLLWTVPPALKLGVGILLGTLGMLWVTFPLRSMRMFLKLLERLLLYSFGMGGVLLFLVRTFKPARAFLTSVPGILIAGGLAFGLLLRFRSGHNTENTLCRAVLIKDGRKTPAAALIDSGNSLVEPISGKPVCVAGRKLFSSVWGEDTKSFRAIPYHSIGKKRGIMPGYLLPVLRLEIDGVELEFENVYIAVSDEEISHGEGAEAESAEIIIHPGLLTGVERREP